MVMRSALVAREDGGVDRAFEIVHLWIAFLVFASKTFPEKDHGSSGATEGFVRRGGYNVGVLEGRRDDATGDEPGDMRHIAEKIGPRFFRDCSHALVVNQATISRSSGDNDLGSVEQGEFLQLVVVDEASGLVQSIWESFEVLGDHGDLLGRRLVAMGKMAAVREVEAHDSVVRVEDGRVGVQVGG